MFKRIAPIFYFAICRNFYSCSQLNTIDKPMKSILFSMTLLFVFRHKNIFATLQLPLYKSKFLRRCLKHSLKIIMGFIYNTIIMH